CVFFFQAEDGIRAFHVTGVQTCALPILPMFIANATTNWLYSPVFHKFPDLKICLSEGGIGWVPYLLERADFTYEHHSQWTNANRSEERRVGTECGARRTPEPGGEKRTVV